MFIRLLPIQKQNQRFDDKKSNHLDGECWPVLNKNPNQDPFLEEVDWIQRVDCKWMGQMDDQKKEVDPIEDHSQKHQDLGRNIDQKMTEQIVDTENHNYWMDPNWDFHFLEGTDWSQMVDYQLMDQKMDQIDDQKKEVDPIEEDCQSHKDLSHHIDQKMTEQIVDTENHKSWMNPNWADYFLEEVDQLQMEGWNCLTEEGGGPH